MFNSNYNFPNYSSSFDNNTNNMPNYVNRNFVEMHPYYQNQHTHFVNNCIRRFYPVPYYTCSESCACYDDFSMISNNNNCSSFSNWNNWNYR